MKKYPVYMWILAISGELERKKLKLCIIYFMKMLEVFEDILREGNLFASRFGTIVCSFQINKAGKKWLKTQKKRIMKKVEGIVHGEMEDPFIQIEMIENGYRILSAFAKNLSLEA